ncbi:hypothetical protein WA158_006202 [Blastocystis sp. Blastoise]
MEIENNNSKVEEDDQEQTVSCDEDTLNEENDSISTDESNSEEENEENNKLIIQFKEKIESNIRDYDSYVKIIELLRKVYDVDQLRSYRIQFKKQFPLSSEMWLEWINDEKPMATSIEDKKSICSLYENALKDYFTSSVYMSYLDYLSNFFPEDFAEKCENYITIGGIDFQNGGKIWLIYRQFIINNGIADDDEDKIDSIRKLYIRQLSIPLKGNETVFQEYQKWEQDHKEDEKLKNSYIKQCEDAYNISQGMAASRAPFEEKLTAIASVETAQNIYTELALYIDFEIEQQQFSRAQVLYELYAEKCCLVVDFWYSYCSYIYESLRNSSSLRSVSNRAIRNIPYYGPLHIYYILSLEMDEQPVEKLTKEMEKLAETQLQGLNDYENVFTEAFGSYRRRILNGEEHSQEQFAAQLDYCYSFMHTTYGAYIEYLYSFDKTISQYYCSILHNQEKWKYIWETILRTRSREAAVWQDYIYQDSLYNNRENVRGIYRRAVSICQDYPQIIINDYLHYEQFCGSLETLQECNRRIKLRMKDIEKKEEKRKKKEEEEQIKRQQEEEKRIKEIEHNENLRQKRIYEEHEEEERKKLKLSTDESPSKTMLKLINQKKKNDESTNKRTIFVTNLSFVMTKEQFTEEFAKYGLILSTNLVCNNKGKSRGFGYIEFDSEESAQKALERNNTFIEDRKIEVKLSSPPSERTINKKENKKYHPTTVYISNIPTNIDEYELSVFFSKCGPIAANKIIRDKRTHESKGYALIQFKDKNGALECLNLKNTNYKGNTIHVSKSFFPVIPEEEETEQNNNNSQTQ